MSIINEKPKSSLASQSYPNPLNNTLALLLGWTEIVPLEVRGINISQGTNIQKWIYTGIDPEGKPGQVPNWCGNWVEAGPLIKKYDIDIMHSWNHTYFRVDKDINNRVNTEDLEGEDSDNVIRQGIVSAIISKLGSVKP